MLSLYTGSYMYIYKIFFFIIHILQLHVILKFIQTVHKKNKRFLDAGGPGEKNFARYISCPLYIRIHMYTFSPRLHVCLEYNFVKIINNKKKVI